MTANRNKVKKTDIEFAIQTIHKQFGFKPFKYRDLTTEIHGGAITLLHVRGFAKLVKRDINANVWKLLNIPKVTKYLQE